MVLRPRTRSRFRLPRERWGLLLFPTLASMRAPGRLHSRPRVRVELDGPDLAGTYDETHVPSMQSLTKTQIVGFMELQVGSLAVQVPIRAAEPGPSLPLASFEVEGDTCSILIRGDSSSKAVERAMGEAARQAVQHLSRKLLN
jgi:hypothetical protein